MAKETLAESIQRMLEEAGKAADEEVLSKYVHGDRSGEPQGILTAATTDAADGDVDYSGSRITAWKLSSEIPMSDELAMDYGLIPDTRPPAPKPSRRVRLGCWWDAHRPHLHFGPCPVEWED
jgi:hypothetical protein